jgi:diguanylate cyclase (GGDEF)-like protein
MLIDLHVDAAESTEQACSVAEKIRTSLALPYVLTFNQPDGTRRTVEHHCTASIGTTLFSGQDESHERILQRADAAMYRAKENGRNRVQFAAVQA